jgi:hypothetical protein
MPHRRLVTSKVLTTAPNVPMSPHATRSAVLAVKSDDLSDGEWRIAREAREKGAAERLQLPQSSARQHRRAAAPRQQSLRVRRTGRRRSV